MLRKSGFVLLALIAGSAVGSLPWFVADQAGWAPSGVASGGLLLLSYALLGLTSAAVYTALHDGLDSLKALLRRRRPTHH